MRSIYSPSDLLKIARPPWFESGRQQDCSEFLRYLLDTLHEQEKSSYNLAVKTSRYGFFIPFPTQLSKSLMNTKLSKHRLLTCNENGPIGAIQLQAEKLADSDNIGVSLIFQAG